NKLQPAVTTNSVRVLRVLKNVGSKQSEGQIRIEAEAMRRRQESTSLSFEQDLKYRMYFLCVLGLVQQTLDEYAITQLGVAFLAKASQDERNYSLAFAA